MFKTWCIVGIIGMLQCVNKLCVLYMCLYMQISASKTSEVCFDEHPDMSKDGRFTWGHSVSVFRYLKVMS